MNYFSTVYSIQSGSLHELDVQVIGQRKQYRETCLVREVCTEFNYRGSVHYFHLKQR